MTVIRPNSISGVTSITAQGGEISYFKSDGTRGNQFTHNIHSTGVVTATKFVGSGADLTGIDATSIKHTDGNVKIQANNSGAIVTGILTANSISIADGGTSIDKHSVGIGTTNTAGRNAGVSTATGTLIYNTTTESLEFYTGNIWVATNLIPLLNSVTGDILNGSATNLTLVWFATAVSLDTVNITSDDTGTVVNKGCCSITELAILLFLCSFYIWKSN